MDSVDGQRGLPSRVARLDLLKVVESSPARRASPDADKPLDSARRSMARHICECFNMGTWSYRQTRHALRRNSARLLDLVGLKS